MRWRGGGPAGDAPITGRADRARLRSQAGACRDHGRLAVVDRLHDLSGVDSLEVDRGDPEVRVSELPLDDRQRDPFVGHLDRVSMPELVWREPPPYPGLRRESTELTTGGGR
jgi:hypothetical protein